MKAKEISRQYGFDHGLFEQWLAQSGLQVRAGITGTIIDDSHPAHEVATQFQAALQELKVQQAEQQEREFNAQARAAREQQDLQAGIEAMRVTTGSEFSGRRVEHYVSVVSADCSQEVDRGRDGFFSGSYGPGVGVMNTVAELRQEALIQLLAQAHQLGANAVLGLSFEPLTFAPETVNSSGGMTFQPYVFGMSAIGTAVFLEAEEDGPRRSA